MGSCLSLIRFPCNRPGTGNPTRTRTRNRGILRPKRNLSIRIFLQNAPPNSVLFSSSLIISVVVSNASLKDHVL